LLVVLVGALAVVLVGACAGDDGAPQAESANPSTSKSETMSPCLICLFMPFTFWMNTNRRIVQ
jgi:hypothetical protein